MIKLPKCPKCGGSNYISCVKPLIGKFGITFVFDYYLCASCDNAWRPFTKIKVVFT